MKNVMLTRNLKTRVIDCEYGPRVSTPSGIVWAYVKYKIEREDGETWVVTEYAVRG